MSMIYILRQASQSTIDRLHSEPSLVTRFFACHPQPPPAHKELLSRIFGHRRPSPSDGPQFPPDVEECSLEKSWHGLHYLLSGSAWDGAPPAAFLLNWGRDIGDVDLGYGPAFSFTPDQTAQISESLTRIDSDSLRKRFDPNTMTELELYPNVWQYRNADDELNDLLAAYQNLRQFVTVTYDQGLGMVGYIG